MKSFVLIILHQTFFFGTVNLFPDTILIKKKIFYRFGRRHIIEGDGNGENSLLNRLTSQRNYAEATVDVPTLGNDLGFVPRLPALPKNGFTIYNQTGESDTENRDSIKEMMMLLNEDDDEFDELVTAELYINLMLRFFPQAERGQENPEKLPVQNPL